MSLKATCRCGHELTVPDDAGDRVVCSNCGARVRIRRIGPIDDGYIRFFCPCGRRLKVPSRQPPSHGKCPECSRIVPVPLSGTGQAESKTEDLRPEETTLLNEWAASHQARGSRVPRELSPRPGDPSPTPPLHSAGGASLLAAPVATEKSEAGLRVCPKCGKPVHLGSDVCRQCGTHVPRR